MSTRKSPASKGEAPDPLTAAYTALVVVESVLSVVRERLADAQRAERERQIAARPARSRKRKPSGLRVI
ncbi:hypothetical protein PV736_02175 [Streptomyces scabiei]|uniref:hypothetical protein n=1 Tax=Streptomyces scabiei TaxID=1930 RepID=UPI000766130F|nr:hypothetical protein [Streptomyces scabiei]MDX2657879.1 hypothetical protein [Streptomyces scabiei]MDX2724519.1 hypothetical protein [Streptomyces scabiei]MDX2869611.1 hypothetical protein [Streptomyces scabiei]MDX2887985.1 hypothetical protein [Streptomyces scabiei]MDX2891629.1 hypothetical protein [Streptomyces scabiei]